MIALSLFLARLWSSSLAFCCAHLVTRATDLKIWPINSRNQTFLEIELISEPLSPFYIPKMENSVFSCSKRTCHLLREKRGPSVIFRKQFWLKTESNFSGPVVGTKMIFCNVFVKLYIKLMECIMRIRLCTEYIQDHSRTTSTTPAVTMSGNSWDKKKYLQSIYHLYQY